MADVINHPPHYNSGQIEVIEAIEDWGLDYHRGNAVKYVARAGRKNPDTFVEDLEKAIWYLRRAIEVHNDQIGKQEKRRPNDMVEQVK